MSIENFTPEALKEVKKQAKKLVDQHTKAKEADAKAIKEIHQLASKIDEKRYKVAAENNQIMEESRRCYENSSSSDIASLLKDCEKKQQNHKTHESVAGQLSDKFNDEFAKKSELFWNTYKRAKGMKETKQSVMPFSGREDNENAPPILSDTVSEIFVGIEEVINEGDSAKIHKMIKDAFFNVPECTNIFQEQDIPDCRNSTTSLFDLNSKAFQAQREVEKLAEEASFAKKQLDNAMKMRDLQAKKVADKVWEAHGKSLEKLERDLASLEADYNEMYRSMLEAMREDQRRAEQTYIEDIFPAKDTNITNFAKSYLNLRNCVQRTYERKEEVKKLIHDNSGDGMNGDADKCLEAAGLLIAKADEKGESNTRRKKGSAPESEPISDENSYNKAKKELEKQYLLYKEKCVAKFADLKASYDRATIGIPSEISSLEPLLSTAQEKDIERKKEIVKGASKQFPIDTDADESLDGSLDALKGTLQKTAEDSRKAMRSINSASLTYLGEKLSERFRQKNPTIAVHIDRVGFCESTIPLIDEIRPFLHAEKRKEELTNELGDLVMKKLKPFVGVYKQYKDTKKKIEDYQTEVKRQYDRYNGAKREIDKALASHPELQKEIMNEVQLLEEAEDLKKDNKKKGGKKKNKK